MPPIQALPPEILAYVLTLAVLDDQSDEPYLPGYDADTDWRLIFTALASPPKSDFSSLLVCRNWYLVGLKTHRIWSDVYVNHDINLGERASRMMIRSGATAFRLTCDLRNSPLSSLAIPSVLAQIHSNLERVRSLRIVAHNHADLHHLISPLQSTRPAAVLRSLRLTAMKSAGHRDGIHLDVPNLRILELHQVNMPHFLTPLPHLTHLIITGVETSTKWILELCLSSPSLQSLKIGALMSEEPLNSAQTVRLDDLTRLSIKSEDLPSAHIFKLISTPSLSYSAINYFHQSAIGPWHSCFAQHILGRTDQNALHIHVEEVFQLNFGRSNTMPTLWMVLPYPTMQDIRSYMMELVTPGVACRISHLSIKDESPSGAPPLPWGTLVSHLSELRELWLEGLQGQMVVDVVARIEESAPRLSKIEIIETDFDSGNLDSLLQHIHRRATQVKVHLQRCQGGDVRSTFVRVSDSFVTEPWRIEM